ncbi:MAG TPA: FAD-dependent oxidoreductase [Limnochordia bacterium]|nr:FAD-dependent oxidoreductase [Limnochordia bacterium]
MAVKPEFETVTSDLTVVGGGMAGLCAAIAAARQGLEVTLVQDRPVLGGNSSSEVRVWVNGATGGKHNRYSREGGIMEEILLENKYRNPTGNAHFWDAILLDFARAEAPRLKLFLNTLITDVEMAEPGRIGAVSGYQLMTERRFRFASRLFVDASGDGVVGAQAGAAFKIGREAASEYNETWAPAEADDRTLGSSVMFYSKDMGEPVPFRPPAFARDFKQNPPTVLAKRLDPKDTRCCYWWIEWGGELDTIGDNEAIRDELFAIIYGAWDYLKNSGKYEGVENLEIEWIASVPGKRESRRFVGDFVLTERDVVAQRDFEDAVAHGGWSIDLHPPKGFYDATGEASRHWHIAGPYSIPYRILYSKDVGNLLLAGRLVSASHVAFGTLRVQMTLATMGQAVGTAAALCVAHDTTPRGVYEHYRGELQQRLLRDDQWVIGVPGADEADLARKATVSATAVERFALEFGEASLELDRPLGLHFAATAQVDAVELLLEAEAPVTLPVALYSEIRPENYLPAEKLGERAVTLAAGRHWVRIEAGAPADAGQGLFLVLGATVGVRVVGERRQTLGVLACPKSGSEADPNWRPVAFTPCFRLTPEQPVYAAANVINGFSRPYGGPNCWRAPVGAALELSWPAAQRIGYVQLAFNSELTPWYNHLRPAGHEKVPELVADYTLEARVGGQWRAVATVAGNYQRIRRHAFEPVAADALRLTVTKTNGAPCAEVFEIRAYAAPPYPGAR